MKKKDIFLFIALSGTGILFICFSKDMRQGAYDGLMLAQNTIIPSLLPLLIIFLIIIKTGARDVFARVFGFLSVYLFNLPTAIMPAFIMGQIGGYPTGAILTIELFENGDIDENEAQRALAISFCGGAGFIITAVGTATLNCTKAGLILLISSILSNIIIGICSSFSTPRIKREFYSFSNSISFSDALIDASSSAMKSVLDITAFIMLFGAINSIINPPKLLLPIFEITQGICGGTNFSIPEISAYLSFGGLCIHLQLLPIILKCKMKYHKFLLTRFISALLSYCIAKALLIISPIDINVFSNISSTTPKFSSLNLGLSILFILGSFILILDINSKKIILK